ncbi:protein rtoA-like [Salvelinus alpinus]|uniref:protein rtoA-like n=1 Tax=Salvelinus alpinus TaxID=8036 RepID=UPI0039FBF240
MTSQQRSTAPAPTSLASVYKAKVRQKSGAGSTGAETKMVFVFAKTLLTIGALTEKYFQTGQICKWCNNLGKVLAKSLVVTSHSKDGECWYRKVIDDLDFCPDRFTIESILSGCITAGYGNCTACNRRALQRVVCSALCLSSRTPTSPDVTEGPVRSEPARRKCHARVGIQPGQIVLAQRSWSPVRRFGPGYPAPALRTVSPVRCDCSSGASSDGLQSGAFSDGLQSGASSDGPQSGASSDDPWHEASSDDPWHEAASDDPWHEASSDDPWHEASSDEPWHEASSDDPWHEASSDDPWHEASSDDPWHEATSDDPWHEASRDDPWHGASRDDPWHGASSDGLQSGASNEGPQSGASNDGLQSRASSDGLQSGGCNEGLQSGACSEGPQSGACSEGPRTRGATKVGGARGGAGSASRTGATTRVDAHPDPPL